MTETFDRGRLRGELERDEGRRYRRYKCPTGHWTIGIGWNLDVHPIPQEIMEKLPKDWDVTRDALPAWAVDRMFDISVGWAKECWDALEPRWVDLDPDRQRVLLNVFFPLGRLGVLGFHRFRTALGDFLDGDSDCALRRMGDELMDCKAVREQGLGLRFERLRQRLLPV